MTTPADDPTQLLPQCPIGVEWTPATVGQSGMPVYRRSDNVAYAKLATGEAVLDLDAERHRTAWLAGTEVPCPQVLDWVAAPPRACLITSGLPGRSADRLAETDLRSAWPSIARILAMLHNLPTSSCPFEHRLETLISMAVDVVGRHAVNPAFLSPEDRDTPPAEMLARLRAEIPTRARQERTDLVVCHGDACLPNFVIDPDTHSCTGLIDLGRLGTADPYVDLSLLVANSAPVWASPSAVRMALDTLCRHCGINEPDSERMTYYLRLDPLTWG